MMEKHVNVRVNVADYRVSEVMKPERLKYFLDLRQQSMI